MSISAFTTKQGREAWQLKTKRTRYVFGLDEHGFLQHMYWGLSLAFETDYGEPACYGDWVHEREEGLSQEEFPAWGDLKFLEPCLKASFSDGVRAVVLAYDSFDIIKEDLSSLLTITLKDSHYPLVVNLHYRVFPEYDLIERFVTLENKGDDVIWLEQVLSASFHFPVRDSYRLSSLAGKWAGEWQLQRFVLPLGKQILESRKGSTSLTANPWFALDADGSASETQGEVWFGALAYSGNWKIAVEHSAHGQTIVSGGLHDFDFRWKLDAGESFETPSFVAGFTHEGFGEASRLLHRYQLEQVLPKNFANKPRPVIYNSWYVTLFDVTVQNQMEAAERAAALGVELFVMDDGWFGQRHHEQAGLGDWYVNPEKFPQGLTPLIEHVNRLGMGFGLWVEPEMVNKDSDLYRAHPDWVYHFPQRPRSEGRHQLVLNLAREDVRSYILTMLDSLLAENKIDFLKWDMNRDFSEPGWPSAESGREQEIWLRHTKGLYEVLRQLRQKHPNVMIESCASGGGRVDLGILRYTDQFWLSDNTDPLDLLLMQEGNSLAYAPKARMAWVTEPFETNPRDTSLSYRFHVAMMGSLGLGANLSQWSAQDKAEAKALIARYKELRDTLQHGQLYRLRSFRDSPLQATQFVAKDGHEAVVFGFLHSSNFGAYRCQLRLQGLVADARYEIEGYGIVSGQALMQRGLKLELSGSFQSKLIHLKRS